MVCIISKLLKASIPGQACARDFPQRYLHDKPVDVHVVLLETGPVIGKMDHLFCRISFLDLFLCQLFSIPTCNCYVHTIYNSELTLPIRIFVYQSSLTLALRWQ